MTTMIAKKVSVSHVQGGTYDIAFDEHKVSTAHEKMRAVADGYRLHPETDPEPMIAVRRVCYDEDGRIVFDVCWRNGEQCTISAHELVASAAAQRKGGA